MNIQIFATVVTLIVLLLLLFALLKSYKQNKVLNLELQAHKEKFTLLSLELSHKNEALSNLKADFQLQKDELKLEYAKNLEKMEEKYTLNLSLLKEELTAQNKLAQQALLTQNKNLLNEDSKKILEEIFTPIKEQVKNYSQRLIQNETSIQTSIKHMFEYSQSVGKNADKLAQILKGDKKIRGNFGELQLKSVLEQSGLIEGEQYKLQESFRNDCATYIPDAIIYLEKNKNIIIDSKFTLPSQLDFEHITSETCHSLANNLKNRIDELAKKPYKEFDSNTYDFVLLFIPYQNLLDLALEVNPNLYQYAYGKKIYLTTPHTLFMALKTIHITWVDIKRNENAQKAFEEIGKFYDKFIGVLESFNDLQNHLDKLNRAKDQLANKLHSGQGNLHSRFEKLIDLGAKNKKSI